jgi:hypothetical protein
MGKLSLENDTACLDYLINRQAQTPPRYPDRILFSKLCSILGGIKIACIGN